MISACTGRLDVPIPVQWQIMKLISLIPGVTNRPLKKIAQNPERAAARSISDVELRRQTVQDPEAGPLMLALQMSTMDRMLRRISGTENDIRQSRMEMDYPLEQIASPTLVVHGTKDSMVPFFQAQSLAARVPGARLLAIEGGEHVAIFTNLSQVRERTTCFLDSLGR